MTMTLLKPKTKPKAKANAKTKTKPKTILRGVVLEFKKFLHFIMARQFCRHDDCCDLSIIITPGFFGRVGKS